VVHITRSEDGVYFLSGRFDASQVESADRSLNDITGAATIDLSSLEYISSAGLSSLLRVYKRLHDAGHALRVVNVSHAVRNVFRYAGLDRVLEIEQ
jgi:anti-anti-sigma factor